MSEPMHNPLTVLFTGGRAPVTLELARLFRAAGHRVVVAESLALPLTRASRAVHSHYRVPAPRSAPRAFVAALLDIVRRECVDLVVPTCEEVFHLAREAAALRPHTRVFVAPFAQLRRLHSKYEFIRSAARAGLPVPHTLRFCAAAELRAYVSSTPSGLVLKPEYSRFATEVLIRPPLSALAALEVSPERPWVAQAYVTGAPVCSYAVAHEGKLSAYAAYGVAYTAGLASTIRFEPNRDARILDWVTRFVAAEGFTGQIAFDFMVTPEGTVLPLECNPRATSGVHLFAEQPELAQAFLAPTEQVLMPSQAAPSMLAIPMLLYGLPRALQHRRLAPFMRDFMGSRDVVFRARDPLPALLQGLSIVELVGLSLRHGRGLLSASTADIEYNGEDACASS
jgi:hypothetical protein